MPIIRLVLVGTVLLSEWILSENDVVGSWAQLLTVSSTIPRRKKTEAEGGKRNGGQPFNFPLTCSWRWRVTACLDSWVEALDIFVSVEPVKVSRFQPLCFNLDRKVKVTQLGPKSQSYSTWTEKSKLKKVHMLPTNSYRSSDKVTQLWPKSQSYSTLTLTGQIGKSCEKKPFVVWEGRKHEVSVNFYLFSGI